VANRTSYFQRSAESVKVLSFKSGLESMNTNLDNIVALIARFAMVFVYVFLFNYFYKGYKKSVAGGYKNSFFLGNSVLFGILSLFNLFYGSYELYKSIATSPRLLTNYFPWYVASTDPLLDLMSNQMRPLFLLFYFLMSVVFAVQVYPLEKAIGWEKTPFVKIILITGSLNWLMWIPPLCNTYLSVVTVVAGFLSIILGMFVNIGVNIKLFINSTGNLKKQSLFAIIAFIILGLGLAISMELGWISAVSYRWEVVIGCVLQAIASFVYRKAFILGIE
jgi:hypothetical protein